MESKEKELKLLSEVKNGNFHYVIELIKEGVDVNFQDSEGNTALHYAVKYGQFFIVKLLLLEGADINSENVNFETPLDFVGDESRTDIELITTALHRHVIEKSFNILETFLKEENSSDESSSDNSIITPEEVTFTDLSLFEEEFKKEVLEKYDKIQSCLNSLKEIVADNLSTTEFTYRQANAVIHFLEVFSISNLIMEEEESEKEKKLPKNVYRLRSNLRMIRIVHKRLLKDHGPEKSFNLQDIGKIVFPGFSISSFFKYLIEYVESVCKIIDGSNTVYTNWIDITTFMKVPFKEIDDQGKDVFKEEWINFMLAIHNEDQWTEELNHRMFFNFLTKFAPAIETEATNFKKVMKDILNQFPNLYLKEKFKNIFHRKFDSYSEFAKFLNGKEKKSKIIKARLVVFKNVGEDINSECTEFTYELANNLLLILDTLIFGNNKEYLLEYMETYFARSYPKFKRDQSLIIDVKNILCRNKRKICLVDVGKVVSPGISLVSFCQQLEEYVESVCNMLVDADVKAEVADLTSLLQANDDVGTQVDDKLTIETFYLVQLVQNQEDWNKERTQEIMFSFLCNISPANEKDISDIKSLKNTLMSTFLEYKNVPKVLEVECKEIIFELRSRLFKYDCAKSVHEFLHKINSFEDGKEISNMDLSCEFKRIEQYFENSYNEECRNDSPTATSIEWEFFNLSLLPSCEELAIKNLVKQYLTYMTIANEHFPYSISKYVYRVILKEFHILKLVKISYPERYLLIKDRIKLRLAYIFERHSRSGKDCFDDFCKIFIENDYYQNVEMDNEIMEIANQICILRRIQTTFQISDWDFLFIFACLSEEKDEFNLEKLSYILRNYDLTEDKQEDLQLKLKEFLRNRVLEMAVDKAKIGVDANTVLYRILSSFNSLCSSYKIKFKNTKDVFDDELILQNLLRLEKKYWEANFSDEQNFVKYLFTIFEQNTKIKFNVTYVTEFIIDEELVNDLEKEELGKLTEGLLEESGISTLVDLLDVVKEDDGIYETILKKVPYMNLDGLLPVFKAPKHTKNLLKYLEKSIKANSDKASKNILEKDAKHINATLYILYHYRNLDEALDLIDMFLGNETEFKTLELINTNRFRAMILLDQGEELRIQNCQPESDAKFESALKICFELKSSLEYMQKDSFEHNAMFILVLKCIATAYYHWDRNSEAYDAWTKLYYSIKNYVLYDWSPNSVPLKPNVDEADDFFDIIISKKYYNLQQFAEKNAESLDVTFIRTLLASRLIRIRWKEHNYSFILEELKLYTTTLLIFNRLYIKLKLKELPYYNFKIGELLWRTGHIHINLYRVKIKIDKNGFKKEILSHMVEALRLNNICDRSQTKKSFYSPKRFETLFFTLHDLAKNRCLSPWKNDAMKRRLNAIREPIIRSLGLNGYVPEYENLAS